MIIQIDEETLLKVDINTFFDWIEDSLSLAECLIKGNPFGKGSDFGLQICFTVLDVMTLSYQDGNIASLRSDHKGKGLESIPKEKNVTNFIKKFQEEYFESRKYEITKYYRNGTKRIEKCDMFRLLRIARNRVAHSGLPIGSSRYDPWSEHRKWLFTSHTSENFETNEKYVVISLVPNSLLSMLRESASSYKSYCIEKSHDPRAFINPSEIRLTKINGEEVKPI